MSNSIPTDPFKNTQSTYSSLEDFESLSLRDNKTTAAATSVLSFRGNNSRVYSTSHRPSAIQRVSKNLFVREVTRFRDSLPVRGNIKASSQLNLSVAPAPSGNSVLPREAKDTSRLGSVSESSRNLTARSELVTAPAPSGRALKRTRREARENFPPASNRDLEAAKRECMYGKKPVYLICKDYAARGIFISKAILEMAIRRERLR